MSCNYFFFFPAAILAPFDSRMVCFSSFTIGKTCLFRIETTSWREKMNSLRTRRFEVFTWNWINWNWTNVYKLHKVSYKIQWIQIHSVILNHLKRLLAMATVKWVVVPILFACSFASTTLWRFLPSLISVHRVNCSQPNYSQLTSLECIGENLVLESWDKRNQLFTILLWNNNLSSSLEVGFDWKYLK